MCRLKHPALLLGAQRLLLQLPHRLPRGHHMYYYYD